VLLIYVRKNLIMRSLTKADAPASYSVIDKYRDYLRIWLPWADATKSPDVTADVISAWETQYEDGSDVVLGIFEGGEYVGNIGLHDMKRHNRSGMIGYWLAGDRQGRGIITDCVRALTSYGFHNLGLNRIYIHCAKENAKSRAVPVRLGFLQEGVLQDAEYLHGVFHDLILYGLVKRNWDHGGCVCLATPDAKHEDSAMEFRREHLDCGESWIHGSGGLIDADDYNTWLEKTATARIEAPEGRVKASTMFLFAGGRIAGTVQIRHTLNEELYKSGGHIGYGVRPSERRKGYGAIMLSLALAYCRVLGISRALVTCDKKNIGSAAVIVKNGGVLENEAADENGNIVQRYWISV